MHKTQVPQIWQDSPWLFHIKMQVPHNFHIYFSTQKFQEIFWLISILALTLPYTRLYRTVQLNLCGTFSNKFYRVTGCDTMTFLAWAVSIESDKKKLFIHFQKMLFVFKQNTSEGFFLRLPGQRCIDLPVAVSHRLRQWAQGG